MNGFVIADICHQVSVCLHVVCGILFALKPFGDYSLCSVCIYSQSVVFSLHSVCTLPSIRSFRSLQSAVFILRWLNTNHNSKTKLLRFVLFDTINICKRRSGPPNKLSDHITQDSHLNINLTTALQAAFPGTSYSAQSSVCSLKITKFITLL